MAQTLTVKAVKGRIVTPRLGVGADAAVALLANNRSAPGLLSARGQLRERGVECQFCLRTAQRLANAALAVDHKGRG